MNKKCRALADDSCHVEYRIDDDGREVENLTHADFIPVDLGESNDELAGWITQPDDDSHGERIQVLAAGVEEFGFDIEHRITADTAEQLSDMFATAAAIARRITQERADAKEARRREDEEIAARQGSLALEESL